MKLTNFSTTSKQSTPLEIRKCDIHFDIVHKTTIDQFQHHVQTVNPFVIKPNVTTSQHSAQN